MSNPNGLKYAENAFVYVTMSMINFYCYPKLNHRHAKDIYFQICSLAINRDDYIWVKSLAVEKHGRWTGACAEHDKDANFVQCGVMKVFVNNPLRRCSRLEPDQIMPSSFSYFLLIQHVFTH